MPSYQAPLQTVQFLLHDVIGMDRLKEMPQYAEVNRELADAILEAAGQFMEGEIFPLNMGGDKGCVWDNGKVTTPAGFAQAYKNYTDGGWSGLSAPTEFGGQGLPTVLNSLVGEFLASSNLSFSLYPGLTQGAIHALLHHGSDALKQQFLPKMIAGTWTGTMNLTEPQAGTDLALLRTKATRNDDGTYNITGTKIYISCGEHDCTDNIIHLVLARLPDAPAGVKGISLFLVPKFWVNEDGSQASEMNNLGCGSIEHKMGLHGSSTCVMNYENARGFLIGHEHDGLRCMFTMMNEARLWVGVQGFAVAETAYQNARNYAFDRLQARGLNGPVYPEKPADPIIVHPDVRKNLLTMKSFLDAFRALMIDTMQNVDVAAHHPDAEKRQQADDFVALMTPIIKAYGTDMGSEIANLAMQVHGGAGYCKDYGMEQLVRDVRITQIYEGTNGIQALDLIGRKMGVSFGRLMRRFFHPTLEMLDEMQTDVRLVEQVFALRKAIGKVQQATILVAQNAMKDKNEAGAASVDYLRMFSLVVMGAYWLRIMKTANEKMESDPTQKDFYMAKINTGKFFFERVLPDVQARFAMVAAGAKPLMTMTEEQFHAA